MSKPSIKTITIRNISNLLMALALVLLVVVGYSFYSMTIMSVNNQALAHAELVRSGLTAHMKAGIMDRRDYYLQEIRQMHDIRRLQVIRGEQVIAQFGTGRPQERPIDSAARQAFTTKAPVYQMEHFVVSPMVRTIIPYIASSHGTLNCLQCHHVEEGAVLGAVDIEIDVTEYRNRLLWVLAGVVILSLLFIVLIILNTSRTIELHVRKPLESLVSKARLSYLERQPVATETFGTREFVSVADEINLFNGEIVANQELLREKNKQLRALNNEIESTLRETVYTMGVIEEQRSKETNQHTRRVSLYCRLFAQKLGLPVAEADLIADASPLHDIGKLGIPDEILLKPGKLTEAEYTFMMRHPEIGYTMLKHSERDLLKVAAIIAWQHHEKWDGSGYPQGLKGEEIHIYGRIVALADVFDALYSSRVYKSKWTFGQVEEWINAQSGLHFDPALVAIFNQHKDEFIAIREAYPD